MILFTQYQTRSPSSAGSVLSGLSDSSSLHWFYSPPGPVHEDYEFKRDQRRGGRTMLSVVARSSQCLESADSTNMASSAFYGLIRRMEKQRSMVTLSISTK